MLSHPLMLKNDLYVDNNVQASVDRVIKTPSTVNMADSTKSIKLGEASQNQLSHSNHNTQ